MMNKHILIRFSPTNKGEMVWNRTGLWVSAASHEEVVKELEKEISKLKDELEFQISSDWDV